MIRACAQYTDQMVLATNFKSSMTIYKIVFMGKRPKQHTLTRHPIHILILIKIYRIIHFFMKLLQRTASVLAYRTVPYLLITLLKLMHTY